MIPSYLFHGLSIVQTAEVCGRKKAKRLAFTLRDQAEAVWSRILSV